MRSATAHQHGTSNVEIAVEGDAIQLRIVAPGSDIVGFEQAATSEEDRQAIDAALEVLSDPLALFRPGDAAGCAVAHADVSIASNMVDADDDADHGHDDHGDDLANEAHLEFVATYHLECSRIEAVDRLTLNFFDQFPNAQRLDFTILGMDGANTASAEREDVSISLNLGG